MRVAISTASPAIRRTLEAILALGDHQLASLEDAECLIADLLHPAPLDGPERPTIRLVAQAKHEHELTCPVRPTTLLRELPLCAISHLLPLDHGWQLDATTRALVHPSLPALPLTEKECSLLHALATIHPRAIPREQLLAEVWGLGQDVETHTLETHIYRLRSKLDGLTPPPCDLVTEAGAYRLVRSGAES